MVNHYNPSYNSNYSQSNDNRRYNHNQGSRGGGIFLFAIISLNIIYCSFLFLLYKVIQEVPIVAVIIMAITNRITITTQIVAIEGATTATIFQEGPVMILVGDIIRKEVLQGLQDHTETDMKLRISTVTEDEFFLD